MSYQPADRITALPPMFAGDRKPGTIKEVSEDRSGSVYDVLLDGARHTMQYRSDDLESECHEGGAHEWVNGICEKCFQAK